MPPRPPSPPAALDAADAKAALRATTRAARLLRSERQRTAAARDLAARVHGLPEVQAARCISVYASRPTEPGTLPLIEELSARGVRVLIPLLGDGLQRGWSDYRGADDLVSRAPGRPPEPSGTFLPSETLVEADVIITPALAVDQTGMRLGQGGGWYDRVLLQAKPDALRVALAFPDEVRGEHEPIPREPHDVPIDVVVTPEGAWRLASSARD